MSVEGFTKFSEVGIVIASAVLLATLVLPHLNISRLTEAKGIVGVTWFLGALTACYGVIVMRVASFMFHRSEHFVDGTVFWLMSGVFFIAPALWYKRTVAIFANTVPREP